jgi:hypothetical protein
MHSQSWMRLLGRIRVQGLSWRYLASAEVAIDNMPESGWHLHRNHATTRAAYSLLFIQEWQSIRKTWRRVYLLADTFYQNISTCHSIIRHGSVRPLRLCDYCWAWAPQYGHPVAACTHRAFSCAGQKLLARWTSAIPETLQPTSLNRPCCLHPDSRVEFSWIIHFMTKSRKKSFMK